jgi:hypothetical protein
MEIYRLSTYLILIVRIILAMTVFASLGFVSSFVSHDMKDYFDWLDFIRLFFVSFSFVAVIYVLPVFCAERIIRKNKKNALLSILPRHSDDAINWHMVILIMGLTPEIVNFEFV